MSRKIKKKKQNAPVVTTPVKKDKRIPILITVMVLTVAIVAVGFYFVIKNSAAFDYENADLSEYINLDPADYKGFQNTINFDDNLDDDVLRLINALLTKNKNQTALHDAQSTTNVPITLGDVAKIYYRGYTLDENGNEIPVSDNLFSSSPHKLEIGSGSFIPGIEEALIGVVPKDYQRSVEKITSGYVTLFDAVYLSYKALYPDGTTADVYAERIDMRLPNIDKIYGQGFKSYLLGDSGMIEIGKKLKDQKIFTLGSGDAIYYDMTVEYVVREDKAPLTIDVVFPSTYHVASLRGVAAKFDVYIEGVIVYDTPEYNEEFITNTLKLGKEELAAYPGDTVTSKHMAMLKEQAKESEASARIKVFDEIIWDYILDNVEVLSLPEKEVSSYFDAEYQQLTVAHSYYQTYYPDLDVFARAYYKLGQNADWRAYLTSIAKETVTKKLIIYYILENEGLRPDAQEYELLYTENVSEYMGEFAKKYQSELESAKTNAEYQKVIEKIKKETVDYYGDDFFKTNVYYGIVINALVDWCNFPILK